MYRCGYCYMIEIWFIINYFIIKIGLGVAAMEDIAIKPVNQDIWVDFEALFQSKGAPSYCWCATWRMNGKELGAADSVMKKEYMRRLILSGKPVGLLAYSEGTPIAWCSVALRETRHLRMFGRSSVFSSKRNSGEKALSAASLRKPKYTPVKMVRRTSRRFPLILTRRVTDIWALLNHSINPVLFTRIWRGPAGT